MLLPADDDALTLNPTCFANTAELEIAFSESDDINIRVRIDYICIGNDSEKVGGQVSARGGQSYRQCIYYTLERSCLYTAEVSLTILHTADYSSVVIILYQSAINNPCMCASCVSVASCPKL